VFPGTEEPPAQPTTEPAIEPVDIPLP
jgi:hypothetical protein